MRKVRFTRQSWAEKLGAILEEFPRMDDVHPFYSDLMNVLYDKDHYKLALGQLSTAKKLISKVGQDYVRLLKYGDSLYRCKQLKRAALGRMCTLMKKHGPTLAYLEQVRQHLSRLPNIDPNARTLIVCGYPNVGKSSFMNKVTRADVEVQPYAFTTKSLYVGHTDYKYLRWQVIDTPGILDRPLEERNTIEMQSVTALAHLRAAVLYLVDVSEQCGYTLRQQAALFDSIRPLFANKPLLVVLNKTDLVSVESLSDENKELLRGMQRAAAEIGASAEGVDDEQITDKQMDEDGASAIVDGANVLAMSVLRDEHVSSVKKLACEKLLSARVEVKMRGKKAAGVLNRVHVAMPKKRDTVHRPPVIPETVAARRSDAPSKEEGGGGVRGRRTEKDLENENGGAGVYSADFRKHYMLERDEWKYDIIPEIFDGKNVADFVDADIDARLAELEAEEEELEREAALEDEYRLAEEEADALDSEDEAMLHAIESRKRAIVDGHRVKKQGNRNSSVTPRTSRGRMQTTQGMREELGDMGIDTGAAEARVSADHEARDPSRGRKRARSKTPRAAAAATAAEDGDGERAKRLHSNRSRSVSRGVLEEPKPGSGLRDLDMKFRAVKAADKAQKKRNKLGFAGESDRRYKNPMPKHLFSGKTSGQKTRDWR